jgi:hypothetical protein
MSVCAIMQPTYLPWLGYYGLMLQVDSFIFLDTAQVVKRYWDVRNRIRTSNGELFLTVPLKKTQHRDDTIFTNALISYESDWVAQHLKSILFAYKKATYFSPTFDLLSEILNTRPETLAELNINLITTFAKKLGISCKFERTSALLSLEGKKDKLLVQVCKKSGHTDYFSPLGSAIYIEAESTGGNFTQSGIGLSYQNFSHPSYSQLHPNFVPYMSAIDAFMNCGFQETKKIIQSGIGHSYSSEQAKKLSLMAAEGNQ